jgi:hypothetical protein
MLYQRGKEKTWWYRFHFGGRIVHESSKSTSKTVAREAERTRRRELELKYPRSKSGRFRRDSSRRLRHGSKAKSRTSRSAPTTFTTWLCAAI